MNTHEFRVHMDSDRCQVPMSQSTLCNKQRNHPCHTKEQPMPTPIETIETINITPHWPSTTRWFARALAGHSFDRGANTPVASFMEQVRYLQQTDPEELQRIIDELK